jgi:hypothetical protein
MKQTDIIKARRIRQENVGQKNKREKRIYFFYFFVLHFSVGFFSLTKRAY